MILLIDNFDSFTFNLYQYLSEVQTDIGEIRVERNNAISIAEIIPLNPSHIVLSPGPCTPNEAGISMEIVRSLHSTTPILGVCLGHQAIAQALGGRVLRAKYPMHGKTSPIFHNNESIFHNIESPFLATRYHSLLVENESLPSCLQITARTDSDEIMALCHKEHPWLVGVQFHPESILTGVGKKLLANFLSMKKEP